MIYRFARAADDLADEGDVPSRERLDALAEFGRELRRIETGEQPRSALFRELAPVVREHDLPLPLFHDLLSAFAQDVTQKRYVDFNAVLDYSRRSANPVGRLLLALYRKPTPPHLQWSDAICSSLQIINFLQDVAIDYAMGRIYLPQDELARFGVTEQQIAEHDAHGAWPSFMRFQADRARAMLWSGAPLAASLAGRIGMEMRMIIAGGDRILAKILAVDGDIFRRRPVLRSHDWILMLVRALSMR